MPVDYRLYLFPARNQNPFSACSAFACCTIQEFYLFRRDGSIKSEHLSSAAFQWYQSRNTTCSTHSNRKDRDEGCYNPDYINQLINNGCCSENTWRYTYARTTFPGVLDHYDNINTQTPSAAAITEAGTKRIFKRFDTLSDDVNEWIAELYNGNILLFCVGKYPDSFFDKNAATALLDDTNPTFGGGHAMAIVGYLPHYNGKEVFIVRNSWGSNWKDNGYCYYTLDCAIACKSRNPQKFIPNFTVTPIFTPVAPITPNPLPASPAPTPRSTPVSPLTPTPRPAPVSPIIPTPRPTPHPVPLTPTPHPQPGAFKYQWWLFDDIAQYKRAAGIPHTSSDYRHAAGLSPQTLNAQGIGTKLNGPGTPAEIRFGIFTNGRNIPTANPRNAHNFTNIDAVISNQDNAGKIIGLGACKLPNENDGYWKWDKYRIPGLSSPLDIKIMPNIGPNPHPPQFGCGARNIRPGIVIDRSNSGNAGIPDLNFRVEKNKHDDKDFKLDLKLFKRVGSNPDPASDTEISAIDWNMAVSFNNKNRSFNPNSIIPFRASQGSTIINIYLTCPNTLVSGDDYYLFVRLLDMSDKEIDRNWMEIKVA